MKHIHWRPFRPLHKTVTVLVGFIILLAVYMALLKDLLSYNKPTETEPGRRPKNTPGYGWELNNTAGKPKDQRQRTNINPNPSVHNNNVDYGQGRWLEIEGLEDYFLWHENYFELQPRNTVPRRLRKCKRPVKNIMFLKTHCTGGDIIVNILNRFADLRNLLVAIPSSGLSTLHWPNRFNWKYMDLMLLDGQLPNILASHTRFNSDVINEIMSPNAAFITILRNPVYNFRSTFEHFEYARIMSLENYTDPLMTFLNNPKVHIQRAIKEHRFTDKMNLIKNGMFFDLGLKTADYHKPAVVRDAISDIEDQFTVVMVYEYLDESLVLLKRRLCWQLDDILYLKHHYESFETRKEDLEEVKQIREWSGADVSLYEYFNKSLWDQISKEGDEFRREVALFKAKHRQIKGDCIGNLEKEPVNEAYKVVMNNNVSQINRYLCEKMFFTEIDYLQYFRDKMERTSRAKVAKSKEKSNRVTTLGLSSSQAAGSAKDGGV